MTFIANMQVFIYFYFCAFYILRIVLYCLYNSLLLTFLLIKNFLHQNKANRKKWTSMNDGSQATSGLVNMIWKSSTVLLAQEMHYYFGIIIDNERHYHFLTYKICRH